MKKQRTKISRVMDKPRVGAMARDGVRAGLSWVGFHNICFTVRSN